MEGLNSALTVLTAMITPAVLISACGTIFFPLRRGFVHFRKHE
jgi:hypothetical protein